ncbi:hypothetical protein H310_06811 [Aphanomyces invadans]|uniref:YbaK/aminoacyl-tRNA synthetase-associated domain-containing protein n=1 Tax=Aphanomyces invadans TaxID=157072 RepID=A0A024U5P3_9STRA|nr:hypothetical protein H310_06811 [Aphanomyces invadans]ETW01222.1 hypothetical protein H310_06811 [Aphanomyces invadans]|eukprot:XP_008870220.1 hypothetical protein H310_06811 [Aphanomyces invadans]
MEEAGVVALAARVEALDVRLRGVEGVARVAKDIRSRRVYSARLERAPHDYYKWVLADRAKFLKCTVAQLCKSIIMENVAWKSEMHHVPRYVCVIVQYKAKINSDKVAKLIRDAGSNTIDKISRKQVNFQHAPPDTSAQLTGFEFNGVSPYGMTTPLPVVVSAPVLELPYIWLGGGAHNVKLKVAVSQCIESLGAIVGDVSESRNEG